MYILAVFEANKETPVANSRAAMTSAAMVRAAARFPLLLVLALCGCGGGGAQPAFPTGPAVDCSVYPPAAASAYILPYTVGSTFTATNTTAHGGVQLYSMDLNLPIGTTVIAARSGKVVRLEASFFDGDHTPGHENFLWVQHADGSVARYFHLTHSGAISNLGDAVAQGMPIALSGDTGHATGPHLHFDVTQCVPDFPDFNALPCGQTLPVTFRNAGANACGVQVGQSYTAAPF